MCRIKQPVNQERSRIMQMAGTADRNKVRAGVCNRS